MCTRIKSMQTFKIFRFDKRFPSSEDKKLLVKYLFQNENVSIKCTCVRQRICKLIVSVIVVLE